MANAFEVPLAAAKWGAAISKGQGDKVRDIALHALVAGARRARGGHGG